MRSAFLGIAVLVLGLGAFRCAIPAMMEDAINGGTDDCDSSHLTSKDLEPFLPDDSPSLDEVYRSVGHCKSGDIPREAELHTAYAATDSVEATARALLSDAGNAGWTRVSPPAGKPVSLANDSANISLKRTVDGETVHFDAYVFPSVSKPKPNPNANIARIQESGAPTGVLLRIWIEGESVIPTIATGNLGILPTPAVGIGR